MSPNLKAETRLADLPAIEHSSVITSFYPSISSFCRHNILSKVLFSRTTTLSSAISMLTALLSLYSAQFCIVAGFDVSENNPNRQ